MIPRVDGSPRMSASAGEPSSLAARLHPGGLVFCAGVGVVLGMMLAGVGRDGIRNVGIPLIWGSAAVALVLEMGRHQPYQYVLTAAAIAGGAGTLLFPRTPTGMVPVYGATAVWVTAVFGARGTARWILQRWAGGGNFGLGVLALSSAITSGVVVAALGGLPSIPGVPSPVSAWMAAAAIQVMATPWFLEKRTLLPVIRPGPAVLLGSAVAVVVVVRILLVR
ncbi:MAG: hypothetical protein JNL10_00390 [Verrucomicrobiales bacterium]|nr:hypothetical protein [Verrucomicrobiales bacterium]